MTGINTTQSVLDQYSTENTRKDEPKSNEMGQDEFLKLMIAELNNQTAI